jgi:hypothetical protein
MNKPKVDPELIFNIVAAACQKLHRNDSSQKSRNDEILTNEEHDLIVVVSDFMIGIDDHYFLPHATLENRCEFLLMNREFFQDYADSKNTDIDDFRIFSLEELQEISFADAPRRAALIDQMMAAKGVPGWKWKHVRFTILVGLATLAITVCWYKGCSAGLDGIFDEWVWNPLYARTSSVAEWIGAWFSTTPIPDAAFANVGRFAKHVPRGSNNNLYF